MKNFEKYLELLSLHNKGLEKVIAHIQDCVSETSSQTLDDIFQHAINNLNAETAKALTITSTSELSVIRNKIHKDIINRKFPKHGLSYDCASIPQELLSAITDEESKYYTYICFIWQQNDSKKE